MASLALPSTYLTLSAPSKAFPAAVTLGSAASRGTMATTMAPKPAATGGAQLRSKLFGSSNVSLPTAIPTTALKETTDRIFKEQAQAQQAVELYSHKLQEAKGHIAKLEAAYLEQATVNAQLQSKVKDDHRQLDILVRRILLIQSAHADLNKTVQSLTAQLQNVNQERAALEEAFGAKFVLCEGLSSQLQQLGERTSGLEAKLLEAHEARCELSQDVQRLTKELESKSEELNKTQAELDAVRMEGEQRITLLSQQLAEASKQHSECAAELASAQAQLAQATAAHEAASEQLGGELSRTKAELQALQEQLESLRAEAATSAEMLATLTTDKADLEEAVASKESAIAATSQELDAAKAELAEAHAKLEELTAQAASLSEELTFVKSAKEALETAAEEQSAAMEKLQAEYADLQQSSRVHAEELSSHNEELKAKLVQFEASMDELSTKYHELSAAVAQEKLAVDQKHEQYIQHTAKMVEEMKAKHRAEVQALQQERDALVVQMQETMQHHAKECQALKVLGDAAVLQEKHNHAKERIEVEAKFEEIKKNHADALQVLIDDKAAAVEKMEKEKGALELRLDEVNENWRKTQAKVAEAELEASKREALLQDKDKELQDKDKELQRTKTQLEAVELELQKKGSLLAGIGLAAHAAAKMPVPGPEGMPAASQPGGSQRERGRPAAGGAQRRNATVQEVQEEEDSGSESSDSEPEPAQGQGQIQATQSEEAALESMEPNPQQALVVHKGAAARRGGARAERPRASQQPIIQEVDSDEQSGSEGEEDRQARGRKRSGKVIPTKAASKKSKQVAAAKPALSGRRLGAMYGSQMVSSQQDDRGNKPNKAKAAKPAKHKKISQEQLQSGLMSLFGGLAGNYSPDFS